MIKIKGMIEILCPELSTPVVVVDLDVAERNIDRMALRLREANIDHWPHIKTHKSITLAKKQIDAGAKGITVAKISEAEVFAAAGFRDIFIAYSLVGEDKLNRFANLHRKINISTTIDSEEVAVGLSMIGEVTGKPVSVFIELDGGLHRGGRQIGEDLISFATKVMELSGINIIGVMGYFGHIYEEVTEEDREAFVVEECNLMYRAATDLKSLGLNISRVSSGSTPAAHAMDQLSGITEIRSGNYVFYDVSALRLGLIGMEDCALRVLATVVSIPLPGRATIDAGTKTLTSDKAHHAEGYGVIVGHPNVNIIALNEEHGFLSYNPNDVTLKVGDRIEIIPNHSCVLPNLSDFMVGIRKGQVSEKVRVDARGCNV